MKNYFITTTIILLVVSSGLFAIDISINGKFYADLRTDFYEGSGMEGGSEPSMDGDPKYKWDASLDLIFKAIFNEDMHAYVNLRADKFLINNNYRGGLSDIRWRDKYIFERDSRGTGTGIALNECYLKWQGIPGFTTEHFGLMEWRLGEGGIYNSIDSRNYPPSHLIYYHPFGLLATRTFGSVSLSFALGLEDTDRLILGSKFRIGDITGAFFTDNYTSDLYSLWSARYASNMPGYWEGRLRRDGILIQTDPYKNDFGDTIHLGAIYSGQLFNKLNLYSLFAFHNYRDKDTEQGQLTGGQLIQIYPEVSVPFIGNSIVFTGGVFYEYWKFNQPDIFETKNKTMDYKLFSQVSFSLSGSNTVAVLFEFVEPHTSGVDFTNTYYNESEDFHYSIMPRFINNFLENVSMETYFKYSTWGPTYNNPETTYAENVEYILGTSLRGYF